MLSLCWDPCFYFKVVDLEDELKTIGENMKILEVEEEKALAREEKFQARPCIIFQSPYLQTFLRSPGIDSQLGGSVRQP